MHVAAILGRIHFWRIQGAAARRARFTASALNWLQKAKSAKSRRRTNGGTAMSGTAT